MCAHEHVPQGKGDGGSSKPCEKKSKQGKGGGGGGSFAREDINRYFTNGFENQGGRFLLSRLS